MCSVCMVGIFISKWFFILTVIVYLDTIGCVIAKMLSVYLSEWNKRVFLLAGVTGSRCENKLTY